MNYYQCQNSHTHSKRNSSDLSSWIKTRKILQDALSWTIAFLLTFCLLSSLIINVNILSNIIWKYYKCIMCITLIKLIINELNDYEVVGDASINNNLSYLKLKWPYLNSNRFQSTWMAGKYVRNDQRTWKGGSNWGSDFLGSGRGRGLQKALNSWAIKGPAGEVGREIGRAWHCRRMRVKWDVSCSGQ